MSLTLKTIARRKYKSPRARRQYEQFLKTTALLAKETRHEWKAAR